MNYYHPNYYSQYQTYQQQMQNYQNPYLHQNFVS
jgi:hypothetical protein